MKTPSKKIIFVVSCIVLLKFFSHTATTKAFSDVPSTNKYFTALEYLVKNAIIQGYADGTFQPFKSVSRAEFLKITMGASKISVKGSLQPSGFPDVDEKSWYAPFVQKAQKEGWIIGYIDGTFRPGQPISKVEALKIIGKIQDWKVSQNVVKAPFLDTPRLAWFTPYVVYAKNKNFLEETGSTFEGNTFITRGGVSEILFRTIITKEKKVFAFSWQLVEKAVSSPPVTVPAPIITSLSPNPEAQVTFQPVAFQTFSKNLFNDVSLTENFPNIFYLHEVYFFEGKIKNTTAKKIFIFLSDPARNKTALEPGNFIEYNTEPASDGSFKIPVIFRKTGNYQLGLIVGSSGESRVIDISVLPVLPNIGSTPNKQESKSINIQYRQGKTTLQWDSAPQQFSAISFYQQTKQQHFFFRQPVSSFDLDFEDFEKFKEGNISINIQSTTLDNQAPLSFNSGWSLPKSTSFKATSHHTTFNQENHFENLKMAEVLSSIQPIDVKATNTIDISANGEVIKPDGSVETISLDTTAVKKLHLGQEIIPANSSFTFHYLPKSSGTYIIEVNDSGGEAILNMPIYVQTGIPIIPDFFDLYHPGNHDSNKTLVTVRQELLDLINRERAKAKLSPVSAKDDLNNLAQLYTEDMKKRNFFGHVNPDGETPDDRRKKAGIPTTVGENLALAPTLLYAHQGLMRSAIHRQNILNPEWQKVGLGITINGNSILIAEEFAPKILTAADIDILGKNIIDQINQKKLSQNLTTLKEDEFLNSKSQQWSDKMVNENFFSFSSPNGESLSGFFSNYPSIVQAYIVSSNNPEKIVQQIIENKQIIDSSWSIVGIGLSRDPTGLLKGTLLLAGN